MINLFRNFAGSLTAKIFLGLVVLSFVIAGGFGASSLSNKNIASVGDLNIKYNVFLSEYKRRIKSLKLTDLSGDELKDLDLAQSVLNSIVARKLVQAETQDLNMSVSDHFIAEKIKTTEYFQKNGKFNTETFKYTLRSAGLTEDAYISILENQLINERFIKTFTNIQFKPTKLASLLAQTSKQKRSGIKAVKAISTIKLSKINTADVKSHYYSNKEDFRIPEMRNTSNLVISLKNITKTITDAQSKKVFEKKKDSFKTEELRTYYAFTGSKSNLEKLIADVKSGKKLAVAVKRNLKNSLSSYLRKNFSRSSLPTSQGNSVFETKKGAFSKIEVGAFNTSVVWVKSITPSKTKSFKSVNSEIKSAMAQEMLLDMVGSAEDKINSGSTLKEVAKSMNINLITAKNISLDGGKANFTKNINYIKEIFLIQKNEITLAIELPNDTFVIARLESIIPTQIPDYKNIKNVVKKAYKERLAYTLLEENLAELKNIKSAKKFKVTAKKLGFKVTTISSLSREKAYNDEVESMLFENKLNTSGNVITAQKGYSVFTTKVNTPKKADDKILETMIFSLNEVTKNFSYKSIIDALREKHTVTVNTSLLNSVYK